MAPNTQISPKDLALACAKDTAFFAKYWFPKTVRQNPALGHREMWEALEDNSKRFVNFECSRGFAKTTIARIYTAKRIAYATTHTGLYVGASDDHAKRSILWLRSKIAERHPGTGALVPTKFAQFYKLTPGSKWNENEIEVSHGLANGKIWMLGGGITASLRGINFDDYRPDFIYCDDILTDENTATKEQREKIFDLVFGALMESLAPVIDEPNAKMVIGQTPHDPDDVCARAKKSEQFYTVSVPCWTKETIDLSVEQQESAWPDRIPTETLRKEKRDAIKNNRYSIFAREKECRLVTRETAAFRIEWARRYILRPEPMFSVLGIDPVPPPSERELAKALHGKDFECHAVVGRRRGEYHILEVITNQGHEPNWSTNTALSLAKDYRVAKIGVESIAYQRVLKYMLEQEMKRRGTYFVVEAYKDHRSKYNRITSTLAGPLAQGRVWVREDMLDLLNQIEMYPTVQHDDILDAVSIAFSLLANPYLEPETKNTFNDWDDDEVESLDVEFGCP